jgi:hypothetical protein
VAADRGAPARRPAVEDAATAYDGTTMSVTALRSPRRFAAATVTALLAAAALAGCGATSGAGQADPAALVPASAPVYAEAVVNPGGAEQADAEAALRRILRTSDPRGELVALFDRAGRDGGVQFARDVEPWLGDRAGVALLALGDGRGGKDAVLVAASRDDAKAADAVARMTDNGAERTYRDVTYRVGGRDRIAAAVLGESVVLGTENALKAAVDASKGSSLAEADRLKKARAAVSEERVGFLYLDVGGLLRQALGAGGDGAAQAAPFLAPVASALPSTVGVALDSEPDLLRMDAAIFGPAPKGAASAAQALAMVPADAWLGVGIGDLGQTLGGVLDQLSSGGGLAGVGVEALLAQVRQGTGLDIRRDVIAWMGDAAVFATGTSASQAGGGLVVRSKDAAATRSAVRRLAVLARESSGRDVAPLRAAGVDEGFIVRDGGRGQDLFVAAGGDRFVVAAGAGALREALSPKGSLTTTAAFRDAAGKLGGGVEPSFFVDLQGLGAVNSAGAKPGRDAGKAREHLDAFGALVGGTKPDGDITRGRAVATLR